MTDEEDDDEQQLDCWDSWGAAGMLRSVGGCRGDVWDVLTATVRGVKGFG